MSQPLTNEQKCDVIAARQYIDDCDFDVASGKAIRAALARLDFLERKLSAAEYVVDMARIHDEEHDELALALKLYDEVN
jgi:hypothetical protein